MPRYYFHLGDHVDVFDDDGVELPDIHAARRHALRAMRSLLGAMDYAPDGPNDWQVQVTDADNRTLFTLSLLMIAAPTAKRIADTMADADQD